MRPLSLGAFAAYLRSHNACSTALEWVGDRDARTAWQECERADWMLWLAARVMPLQPAVLAACDCAETAWQYVTDGDTLQAAMLAVHVTREWAAGRADLDDVRAARFTAAYAAANAAYATAAADAAADAADAAAYAAYSAAYSAAADAAAADAADADAAANAAYAAADANAAAAANATAARTAAHREMCDVIRNRITADDIVAAIGA